MQNASAFTIASSARRSDAVLYRGLMQGTAAPVMLKVPHSKHPYQVERLRNEFEIGGALQGTPALQVIALETYQGVPALVLEHFDGDPLVDRCGSPMPIDEFLPVAVRIASALAAVHERGVIHKNLKPDNILVDWSTGEVRLADFGIATLLLREQQPGLSPRLIEGSLPYLAPEQTGWMNRAIDARSDLYALGVTFYQLLTGRLPYDAHDPLEWVHCHVARHPVPPADTAAAVPLALSNVVMKLLAKVAEERYQSARGVQHDLEACLVHWRADRASAPFSLGDRDFSSSFQVAQKLYGREVQVTALLQAFDRTVSKGKPELLLVAGYAGIGKSALVNELRRPVVQHHAFFLAGKFDQYKRNMPYATIAQSFGDLVLDILAGNEQQIADWRRQILSAVGAHGQLLLDIIPPLELLIGKQPPVPELGQQEAQHRFLATFRQFLQVFTRPAHPVVLFLDDLQWADSATLALLTHLATHPDTQHLLLIGAYRDNEVPLSHPLSRALQDIRKAGVTTNEIALGPLSLGHLSELIADTVHCPVATAAPLARLVHDKTAGNPFFVLQFLTALHQGRLIVFDGSSASWCWDVDRIRAKGFTDNVVDLMVSKLQRLGPSTRTALKMLAAMSSALHVDTLARVDGRPKEQILQDLREAVREGLLLRQGEVYAFLHDRVRQAAYSLIGAGERAALHLRIGRLLLAQLEEDPTAEALFDVCNQLNQGAALITDDDERLALGRLNLTAARKARSAAAFGVALTYATTGVELLPADAWQVAPDLAFALVLERAEGDLVNGQLTEAQGLLMSLLPRTSVRVQQAKVYRMLVDLHTRRGESARALECASQCLALYDLPLPPEPTAEHVQTAEAALWKQLAGRQVEDLINHPVLADPDLEAAASVLTFLLPTAYFTNARLHRLIAIHLVDLTLRHGVMPASPMGFASFGLELCTSGKYVEADRFGQLACAWVDRHGFVASRPTAYMITGAASNAYNHHYRTSLPLFREAFQAGLEIGDLLFASFCSNFMTLGPYLTGNHLAEVAEQAQASVDFLQRAQYQVFIPPVASVLNLALRLRDGAGTSLALNGPHLDERVFEEQIEPRTLPIVTFGHNLFKLMARYFEGDFQSASAAIDKVAALATTMRGQMAEVEAHVFCALASAATPVPTQADERERHLTSLRAHAEWLRDKAAHCPENFLARYALVSAELARVEGRDEAARDHYIDAITAARNSGLLQYEALGNELAARLELARGRSKAARGYLEDASDAYERWGAAYKVQALRREFPVVLDRAVDGPGGTLTLPAEHFDLLSVAKASQAISGQIVLDDLVAALVSMALEQGGAERGLVILERDGEPFIEAEATLGRTGTDVALLEGTPLESGQLPVTIARFAWRTRERVILDASAASLPSRFASDPYLAERRPRSLLCLPIVRESAVVGLVYLENSGVAGAFTGGRLAALELLAAQAAISIENARLLRREQAARSASDAASRQAAFLAEASALLSESLDHELVLARLARIVVRSTADWCVLDVIDNGEIHRVAGAHVDPDKEVLLSELQRRYPARWDSPHPATEVLRTGKPMLLPEIDQEAARRYFVDDEHLSISRSLGTATALVAPLVARGKTLGAVSLGRDRPGHPFGEADLALVEELARRAGTAIDNAQLYRQAQEATRLRDDFLSVASHELNTPMTSLRLSLAGLVEGTASPQPDLPLMARMATLAERQSRRMTRLIHDLLDVTRIKRGPLWLRREEVELCALVREALLRFGPELAKAGCAVTLAAPGTIVGHWDAQRLDQVMLNLLANAAKFGAGKAIQVSVSTAGDNARVSVTDHGIGIEPRQQAHIFDRFGRGVSAQHYGGLGLGLYICQRIMEAHHGSITVTSQLGQGATFVIQLPLGAPPSLGEHGPQERA